MVVIGVGWIVDGLVGEGFPINSSFFGRPLFFFPLLDLFSSSGIKESGKFKIFDLFSSPGIKVRKLYFLTYSLQQNLIN